MKICAEHWQICRDAIEERGMSALVARDGKEAVENAVEELRGGEAPFDPLMSMNWFWSGQAIHNGGLYLMAVDAEANPNNDGHYCPICEFAKHYNNFDAKAEVGRIADQMATHARAKGLVPPIH